MPGVGRRTLGQGGPTNEALGERNARTNPDSLVVRCDFRGRSVASQSQGSRQYLLDDQARPFRTGRFA